MTHGAMSDASVIASMTKLLCLHGGRLNRILLPIFLECSSEQIEQILKNEPQKFPVVGDLVLARSPVRICPKYLKSEREEKCDKLHLCKEYLQGKCWRLHCNFSHDISSDYNQLVLKVNEINGLNIEEVKVLLLQNDNTMLPENFQILCELKHNENLKVLMKAATMTHEKWNLTAICNSSGGRKRKNFEDGPESKIPTIQQVSAGTPAGLSSVFQRELNTTPVTTTGPARSCRLFDSISEGPSVQIEKPVNICTASPSIPQSMCTFMESSTCPNERISKDLSSLCTTSFNYLTKDSFCSLEEPTITFIASPSNPPLVDLSSPLTSVSFFQPKLPTPPVTVTGPANAPQVNTPLNGSSVFKPKPAPFLVPEVMVPPMVYTRQRILIDSLDKGPSVPPKKPVTSSPTSPFIRQSVFAFMSPSTPPAAGPSTAPSSCTRLNNSPTKGPSVPLQNRVDSMVRSQTPVPPICTVPDFYQPNPDRVPEICLSNLWKYCSLGKDCPDMHYYLPYRWQIHKGITWEDVPNMEEVEKSYCDPKVDSVPLIDFLTMRSGGHRVRRLSTVSSVMKPSEYVLTTEWLWYWRDEYGSLIQYGQSIVNHMSATISSSYLENIYLADANAAIPFAAGIHNYEMSFRDMKQKNIMFKTERDVRRRPKFLNFEDVKLLRGSTRSAAAESPLKLGTSPLNLETLPLKSGTSPMNNDFYPKTWDLEAMPEVGCKKVLVSDFSFEFLKIDSNFSKTVRRHEVKKIWRLQNPSFWQVFQWQKEQMKKVNQGQDVKEMQLFHGTDSTHTDAICDQNFDWRICGTHGTVLGQGSYFARDASYSHIYSTPTSSGTQAMFIARVLVGDYVTGNPQMKRPPLRPGSSRYYDSCVDNIISPSIFVVFEKHQIYPEYLLEYEEEQENY
ncbi:zinc finger CCCH-type antiviral protein 1-like isoform X2 [Ranitomeya variabilis]|uniref:zinc finger CCCH-type antiviral protein 1-like isoform X2 n=1 Tax=Ranitomeya variabilis TaxID=490064 RepID=UPI004057BD14